MPVHSSLFVCVSLFFVVDQMLSLLRVARSYVVCVSAAYFVIIIIMVFVYLLVLHVRMWCVFQFKHVLNIAALLVNPPSLSLCVCMYVLHVMVPRFNFCRLI